MDRRSSVLSVFAAISAVTLIGCGQTSPPSSAVGPSTGAPAASGTPQVTVDYNRAKVYTSVAELTSDSSNVAIVRALPQVTVQKINDLPFTRTPIKTLTNLKGVLPSTAVVRQLGGPGVTTSESSQSTLLQPGGTYLLMLDPFKLSGRALANEYVVSGETAGLYREDPLAPGDFGRVVLSGPDALPITLRAEDVR